MYVSVGDGEKMREDRHNSCIMIVTSEPFMIYLCIVFVTRVEVILLTERNVWLGGWVAGAHSRLDMDGRIQQGNRIINELINLSVADSGRWPVRHVWEEFNI